MSTITGSSLAYRIYSLINAMIQPSEKAKKEALDKLGEAFSFVDDKNIPDTIANKNEDNVLKESVSSLKAKIAELEQSIKSIKEDNIKSEDIDKKINNIKSEINSELEKVRKATYDNSNRLSHLSNENGSYELIEKSVNDKLVEFTKYTQGEFQKINDKISGNISVSQEVSPRCAVITVFKGKESLENGIEITYENAKLPTKHNDAATGYDAYACFPDGFESEKTIYPGKTEKISLGIICNIEKGYEIQVRPRSGLSSKGISVAFGSVDEDYRGVIKANVTNLSKDPYTVRQGDRIAQLVVSEKVYSEMKWAKDTDKIDKTERGANGFGSSGI